MSNIDCSTNQLILVDSTSTKKPDPLVPVIEKLVNDLHQELTNNGYKKSGYVISDDDVDITIDDVKEVMAQVLPKIIDFSEFIDDYSECYFFFEYLKDTMFQDFKIHKPEKTNNQ